jgi:cell division protein FtsL
MKSMSNPFIVLWALAVAAATAAFVVHLGTRVRTLELGYELGDAHSRLSRLREVKRVLLLERATYETPERVDFVTRTLFGLSEPEAERLFAAGRMPTVAEELESETPPAGGGDGSGDEDRP